MKYALSLLSVATGLLLLVGCSEKFKVAAPYKNITVVYALIDISDTAHYIRIQKAFLDNDKSSVTMSQNPDSSFYSHLNVRINRYKAVSGTPVIYDTIHLTRVDLNAEGYPKQQGAFFTAPNYAYKFTNKLSPAYIYRLVITNLTTGEVDSADAPIIDSNMSTFSSAPVDNAVTSRSLDFFSGSPNKFTLISGSYQPPSNFYFNGLNSPVAIAQAIIRFNWIDSNTVTNAKSSHSSDLDAGYLPFDNASSNTVKFQITHLNMCTALANGMGAAPANTVRLLAPCDIYFYVSTQDFYTYETIAATKGTGLTGSEVEPTYTNIQGANVLGLYTSRSVRSGSVPVTEKTLDSIMVNPIFSQTNLKGRAH